MVAKIKARLRRAKKTRMKIRLREVVRLSVHRTSQHIYAQITTADGAKVLTSASTLEKDFRSKLVKTGNKEAATLVGELIGNKALAIGIKKVAFDRSGFVYHGRIKALADGARTAGLQF